MREEFEAGAVLDLSAETGGVGVGTMAPLYYQIFLTLKDKIERGDYEQGNYLPSERELAEMFGVSRITAIRSLNELAIAGLVVRERGRGTRLKFVESGQVQRGAGFQSSFRSTVIEPELQPFIQGQGDRPFPELSIDRFDYVTADEAVAEALKLGEGEQVQLAVRTIRFEAKAFNQVTTYVPARIGHEWSRGDLERKPLLHLLRRAGVTVSRVDETVSATLADDAAAAALGVEPGSALLSISRICLDADGNPVEYLISLCVPDRYSYNVAFSRQLGGDNCHISSGPVPLAKAKAPAAPARRRASASPRKPGG